jgi:hypothetical protein
MESNGGSQDSQGESEYSSSKGQTIRHPTEEIGYQSEKPIFKIETSKQAFIPEIQTSKKVGFHLEV